MRYITIHYKKYICGCILRDYFGKFSTACFSQFYTLMIYNLKCGLGKQLS